MSRDEQAGVQLPEPGEAQAEAPETVEPEDGEGRTVRSALRDDVTDVDVADDGAGAPDVADATTGDAACAADADDGSGAESARAEDDAVDRVTAADDAAVADTGGAADPADGQPGEPAVPVDAPAAVAAEVDAQAGPGDVGVGADDGAGERAVGTTDDVADRAVDGSAVEAEATVMISVGASDGLGAAPGESRAPTDADPADEPTAVALPTGVTPPEPPAQAGDEAGDDATVVTSLPLAPGGPVYEEVATSHVVQDAAAEMSPTELRIDFGAHLEANYQRLVAQMYAITLSAEQAHSVVQDAYSRAWRNWSVIGRSADPTGWVRRVAVRTTMRGWRHMLARFGLSSATPKVAEGLDERTTALLTTLRELPAPERRSVVLFHMAGLSPGEIASVEQVSPSTISTRLDRARRVVLGDNGDLLTGVIAMPGVVDNDRGYVGRMATSAESAVPLDDRWERTQSWNGGPDGSWLVSEAPPWDAPTSDEWPRFRPEPAVEEPRTADEPAPAVEEPRAGDEPAPAAEEPWTGDDPLPAAPSAVGRKRDWSAPWSPPDGGAGAGDGDDRSRTDDATVTTGATGREDSEDER